jgi:phage terminase small subunit
MGGIVALTPKQQRFVAEYLVDLNGAQAVIRAGYVSKRPDALAYDNLRIPEIRAQIDAELDKRSKRTHLTADRVALEISRLAFVDTSVIFDPATGVILPVSMWPDDVRASVSSIKLNDYGLPVEVKFWDKGKQLDLAARHCGMLRDKVEITGADGGPVANTHNIAPTLTPEQWIAAFGVK